MAWRTFWPVLQGRKANGFIRSIESGRPGNEAKPVTLPLLTRRRNSPKQERRVIAEGTRGTRTSVRGRPLDRNDPDAAARAGPDPNPPLADLSPDQLLNFGPVALSF